MKNNLRYIARIFIETTSGFAINSGDKSLLLDNAIARDANGLPYVPGTSVAGIVQHVCLANGLSQAVGNLFGYAENDARQKGIIGKEKEGCGSRLMFSSGHLVSDDGQTVIDGLTHFSNTNDYFQKMLLLPQRDHVRMTDRGTADVQNHGKYDRELVFKGTRFCFEIQLTGTERDRTDFEQVLTILQDETVRLGAGTRKGAGKFKVLTDISDYWILDLTNENDLLAYLNTSSNLNMVVNKQSELFPTNTTIQQGWKKYDLTLQAEDFFLFGAGFADEDADNTPKREIIIEWKEKPEFKEKYLIPATSIKGAISHRNAYHYNQLTKNFIGSQASFQATDFGWQPEEVLIDSLNLPDTSNWKHDDPRWDETIAQLEKESADDFLSKSKEWQTFKDNTKTFGGQVSDTPTGENNAAVKDLFGQALNDETQANQSRDGQIGRILIDDIYLEIQEADSKVFNHVKIDRFTGGAYNGALFQEKALQSNQQITINFWVNQNGLKDDNYLKAFELTLEDLKMGHLALGGATTKGYGVFKATTA
ncbi:MAG: RAMP superfamily CRISPR-associated protein [Bacteroidetes bacterium]|nr:RAMP superfamily CRISPR-associated protein [Bacteroidota bacterium]